MYVLIYRYKISRNYELEQIDWVNRKNAAMRETQGVKPASPRFCYYFYHPIKKLLLQYVFLIPCIRMFFVTIVNFFKIFCKIATATTMNPLW